jgi:hypothetical protein
LELVVPYGETDIWLFFFTIFEFHVTNFLPQFQKFSKKGLYSHSEKGFFTRLKIELWKAVDARNGGLEAQNAAVAGPYANGRRFATLS